MKGTLRIPADIQRIAVPLIDQQMWCWGCDVRRAQGNLLVAYGAHKRPSADDRYHSAYSFHLDDHAVLSLWGWGLWLAHPAKGSLFISRSRFRARYSATVTLMPDAWQVRDLPPMSGIRHDNDSAHADALLSTALVWIGAYERWIAGQTESAYRASVMSTWPQRRQYKGGIPSADMADLWFELGQRVTTSYNH